MTLSIKNNRSGVLLTISNFYLKLTERKINNYTTSHLSMYLCVYRKGYYTEQTLIEKKKNILDDKGIRDAVLMDLLKISDALNHELLITKFHANGLNKGSLKLINNYLSVAKDKHKQHRAGLIQVFPQESVLGSLVFITYLNDFNFS